MRLFHEMKKLKQSMIRNRAFTLLEMLLVVAMVSILSLLAVGGWRSTTLNSQSTKIVNTLLSSVLTAHAHATNFYESAIMLCPSGDGTTCNTTDWSRGWIAILDENGDGVAADTETLLVSSEGVMQGFTVTALGFGNRLVFDSNGMPQAVGTFVICDQRGALHGKAVVINGSGQTRIATDEDGDGIVNTHLGGNVTCA